MRINELNVKPQKGYNGYLLPVGERSKLLAQFPPKYPDVIAHHITVKFPAMSNEPLPEGSTFRVIGYTDDGQGLECCIVEIDGTYIRADNSIYHVTLSIDRSKGYKPVDSNKIIKNIGFTKITPFVIKLIPTFFRF